MDDKKILIVDDENDVRFLLKKGLSNKGYNILSASNGEDALVLAKSKQPDLIILDVLMPGMDGPEVDVKLKEDPKTKDIPVMFLTSLYTKKEESVHKYTAGDSVMFAKPYDMDELVAGVEKMI
jgi:two-component system alkaline phosphatase synthesis response regulator PhoP